MTDTPHDDIARCLDRLDRDTSADDVGVLNELREHLVSLLAKNGGDGTRMRAELAERRESGSLRQETLELVMTMLKRLESEHVATAPSANEAYFNDVFGDDEHSSTMVLATGAHELPPKRERNLQVGSVLRDRFLLKEQVSGGSMGRVFRALDTRRAETGDEQPFVAIKVLSTALSHDARALRALQQEAAKMRCLVHEHIVQFIDIDRDDDLYFIVMEWLDGENLASVLDRDKKLNVAEALEITHQVGEALAYAHERGIVHADVKPANVMIRPNGDAKLFDFGIARVRQTRAQQAKQEDAVLPGALTPAYSSMQVLTGEEPVAEDDVFSLACLMYRLIAGYRVFGPRNAAEAAEAGMAPQPLPGLTEKQWKALKKALSFSRVTRFGSIREFLAAIEDDSSEVVDIRVDATGRFTTEPERRGPRAGPILAVVAVLAAAGAYFGGVLDPWLPGSPAPTPVRQQAATVEEQAAAIAEPLVPASDEAAALEQSPPAAGDEPPAAEDSLSPAATSLPEAADSATGTVLPSAGEPEPETVAEPESRVEATEGSGSATPDGPAADGGISAGAATAAPVTYPPGDIAVSLDGGRVSFGLREDAGQLAIDLLLPATVDVGDSVTLELSDYTGNQSPLANGELVLSATQFSVAAGQDRLQFLVGLSSDPVREADQQVELVAVDAEGRPLATMNVTLEDDDQRRFAASVPVNTVAFVAGQASVSEAESAVQIDLLRYRPDPEPLDIRYEVSDVTATMDEDYFPPAERIVRFAPGQRSARLLIPLVQDSLAEGNEAFVIELKPFDPVAGEELFQRIAVFIRDDD